MHSTPWNSRLELQVLLYIAFLKVVMTLLMTIVACRQREREEPEPDWSVGEDKITTQGPGDGQLSKTFAGIMHILRAATIAL